MSKSQEQVTQVGPQNNMKIPQNKWVQLNKGDKSGNIFASWNLDVGDNLKASGLPQYIIDDSDLANLGLVNAITETDADGSRRWWAMVDNGRLFKTTGSYILTGSWTQDSITDTPTNCQDMETFRGDLIVAESNDLAKMSSGSWDNTFWTSTLSQSALDSSSPIVLHNPDFVNSWLLVGNGNKVHVITSNNNVLGSGEGRIVLPPEHTVEWIRSTSNSFWIGTSHNFNKESKIFQWNGRDSVPSNSYSAKAQRTYSGVELDDVMYTINSKGQLLGYSGSSFDEVSRLPVANEPTYQRDKNSILVKAYRLSDDAISQRGMTTIDDQIHIMLNAEFDGEGKILNEMPSGIWVFDKNHGLSHKYGLGQNKRGGTDYDWGSPIIKDAGAITPTNDSRKFIYGAEVFTDHDDLIPTLGIGGNGDNRGYFVTSRIFSSGVKEAFNKIWVILEKMRESGEEIIIKYRTEKDISYPIQGGLGVDNITWSDTDTFTTTNSAYSDVEAGDEIQILNGKGAGYIAHVSSISESSGTYTVNLDETVSNATGTAYARVMNWKKAGKVDNLNIQSEGFGLKGPSEWVQFKIEIRSKNIDTPQLDKLELGSKPSQTV